MNSPNWRRHWPQRTAGATTVYQLTDRLHDGHSARVPDNQITATVSAWLAELGARSPLVDDSSERCATAIGSRRTHSVNACPSKSPRPTERSPGRLPAGA